MAPKKKTKSQRKKVTVPSVNIRPSPSDMITTIDDSIDDYSIIISQDKKSFAWRHFGQLFNMSTNTSINPDSNYCNPCFENLKIRIRNTSSSSIKPNQEIRSIQKYKNGISTTNMTQHLINEHKILEEESATASSSKKLTEYSCKISDISNNRASEADKNHLLARRLVLLCCRTLISYHAVSSDSEGFSDFLKSYKIVTGSIPHRTTLTRNALNDVYFEVLPLIKVTVQKQKYCSITSDLWTDNYRRNGYITFNFCCITANFELLNLNLRTAAMPGKHTSFDISREFRNTRKAFGIEDIFFYFVTDRGSNMVKLINDEQLNNHYCVGHGLHNSVNVDGFESVPEIDQLLAKVKKIVKKLRYRTVQLEEEDKSIHREILASIDVMDDAAVEDIFGVGGEDDEGFTSAERYPLKIICLANNPNDPSETINKKGYKTIKGYSKTRWHSILIMLESLGSQRVAVNRVLYEMKCEMSISTEEWDLIHKLIAFLKVFRDAVEMFSYEKKPTLSNALLFRIELENTLKTDNNDHDLIAKLKENMLSNFDHRFPITEEMLIATLLDPRLQNLPRLLAEMNTRNTSRFEFLKAEIIKIAPNVVVQPAEESQTRQIDNKSKRKQSSILTKLIEKHANDSSIGVSQTLSQEHQKIDEEIHKYFLTVIPKGEIEDFDILKFWGNNAKALPYLAELSNKILHIPVTSTSSERAFSYAGLLINAKRSCLGPSVVEKTLFIHDNYSLVKKIIFDQD